MVIVVNIKRILLVVTWDVGSLIARIRGGGSGSVLLLQWGLLTSVLHLDQRRRLVAQVGVLDVGDGEVLDEATVLDGLAAMVDLLLAAMMIKPFLLLLLLRLVGCCGLEGLFGIGQRHPGDEEDGNREPELRGAWRTVAVAWISRSRQHGGNA